MRFGLLAGIVVALAIAQSAAGFAALLVKNVPVENGAFEDFDDAGPAAWRVPYGRASPVPHDDGGALAAQLTPNVRGDGLLQQSPVISQPVPFVPGSALVLSFQHHLAGPPDAIGYAEICWVTDAGVESAHLLFGANAGYTQGAVVGHPGGATAERFIINFLLLLPDGADMEQYSWSVDNVEVRFVAPPALG